MMALLKAFVVGAGVLLVFGFALLVLLLFERERERAAPPGGERVVGIPQGMRAVELRPDGRRLVLLLEDPDGRQAVLVLDGTSGERTGLFHLAPTDGTAAARRP
jgi:hypothetical protein